MRFDRKIKPEVFASKDTTRMHLVRVQLDAENKRLVATDGHRMIVTPVEDVDSDHTGPLDPSVLIAARKSAAHVAKSSDPEARACADTLSCNGHVELSDGSTYLRPGNAADFPTWQRVVPSCDSDVKAIVAVDSEYLASVFKACGKRAVTIRVRGELDPIVFTVQGELGETTMVVMPMRR